MTKCFISYTSDDVAWARWISDVCTRGGHSVTMQGDAFLPGHNFVLEMEKATRDTERTLVILSKAYLESEYGAAEWAAAFAQDPSGHLRRLIPLAIEPVDATGLWSAIIRVQLYDKSEEDAERAVLDAIETQPSERPLSAFPGQASPAPDTSLRETPGTSTPTGLTRPKVNVWRLPVELGSVTGRERELARLDASWQSTTTNVAVLAGWSGQGKTSIVASWLGSLAANAYLGAQAVFAWSFDGDEQGGESTSDAFLEAALSFFVDSESAANSTWERARQLTTVLQQTRSLLILDGVDRILDAPRDDAGSLREPVMRMLLRDLAALNRGMVVVTSRVQLADLVAFENQTVQTIRIDSLTTEAACALLRDEDLKGSTRDIEELAQSVMCHPLSLRLLASYIRTAMGGDVRKWRRSDFERAVQTADSKPTRIISEYETWFEGEPEGEILAMLGLFDRPATERELHYLRTIERIPELNGRLFRAPEDEWSHALGQLRSVRLVLAPDRRAIVDAHPLVRSYFREQLHNRAPDAARRGHALLYEYATHGQKVADTVEECASLVDAIWHATNAGLSLVALEDIYWPRLARDTHFLRDDLGAAALDHQALGMIRRGLIAEGTALDPVELTKILNEQSLDLRMMGRTKDALAPLLDALETIESVPPVVAANLCRHLAQLYTSLALVDDGLKAAMQAVSLTADLPDDRAGLERLAAGISLADVQSLRGDYEAAAQSLVTCGMVPHDYPSFSEIGAARVTFYICVYRAVEVAARVRDHGSPAAAEILDSAADGDFRSFLETATARAIEVNSAGRGLQLARALMDLAVVRHQRQVSGFMPDRATDLDEAVTLLRLMGQRPWLVEGLRWRAEMFSELGLFDGARRDIVEARTIAESDGLELQTLQCRCVMSRIERLMGNQSEAELIGRSVAEDAARAGVDHVYAVAIRLAETA